MFLFLTCKTKQLKKPGDNTPRDSNYTDTCPPSQKPYKFDKPDTQDTAGEARTSS